MVSFGSAISACEKAWRVALALHLGSGPGFRMRRSRRTVFFCLDPMCCDATGRFLFVSLFLAVAENVVSPFFPSCWFLKGVDFAGHVSNVSRGLQETEVCPVNNAGAFVGGWLAGRRAGWLAVWLRGVRCLTCSEAGRHGGPKSRLLGTGMQRPSMRRQETLEQREGSAMDAEKALKAFSAHARCSRISQFSATSSPSMRPSRRAPVPASGSKPRPFWPP